MVGSNTIKDPHCFQRSKEYLSYKVQSANHVWKNQSQCTIIPLTRFNLLGIWLVAFIKSVGGEINLRCQDLLHNYHLKGTSKLYIVEEEANKKEVYVEIKCQLHATDDFYCRSYCLLNMFRAPLCPSSGAREYYTSGCCLSYFVLWFSSCRYGVELRVMCPVKQQPANRTHNPQLHTIPTTWKPSTKDYRQQPTL
jgi:hypothetical protein